MLTTGMLQVNWIKIGLGRSVVQKLSSMTKVCRHGLSYTVRQDLFSNWCPDRCMTSRTLVSSQAKQGLLHFDPRRCKARSGSEVTRPRSK